MSGWRVGTCLVRGSALLCAGASLRPDSVKLIETASELRRLDGIPTIPSTDFVARPCSPNLLPYST
jgi:hypothetical protein